MNGFIITLCVCLFYRTPFLTDIVDRIKYPIEIPKPFSCGECMSFWSVLLYYICLGDLFCFLYGLIAYNCYPIISKGIGIVYTIIMEYLDGVYKYIKLWLD